MAQALRDWLPNVLQTIEPWLSSEDIPFGDRWQTAISRALEGATAGIICLTRENLDEALRLLRALSEQGRAGPVPALTAVKEPRGKPRVFIGSSTEGLQVAELIQLGLEEAAECTLWTQSTFAPAQTTIESIVDVS